MSPPSPVPSGTRCPARRASVARTLTLTFTLALVLVPGFAAATRKVAASELLEVGPLTERILLLHFKDGHVEHHRRGEPRNAERVFAAPLDVDAAVRPASYRITSTNDPAYREGRSPEDVGRKSKGTDFAWFVDRWENGRTVNRRPDHTREHWLYLRLPEPLREGRSSTRPCASPSGVPRAARRRP